MRAELAGLREQALTDIAACQAEAELDSVRVRYLGKKGSLNAILRGLGGLSAEDRPAVCFVIGGADGLAASLRGQAKLNLAFGTATWPHQLVRVMLLEQLYRATTILTGHPYHRA